MDIGGTLGWKFNHIQGITTRKGIITEWPDSLGVVPSDAQIAIWGVEFDKFLEEHNDIIERASVIQMDRERKEAIRQLQIEGKTFDYFDIDGKRI